jgi:hypothetical protein
MGDKQFADARINLAMDLHLGAMDKLNNSVHGLSKHLDAGRTPDPIFRIPGNATTLTLTNGQTSLLELGTPAASRFWRLTRFTLTGADDHTAAINLVAALYIGDSLQANLMQCIVPNLSVPSVNAWNDKFAIVKDRDSLFVNFTATGAVTNQVVTASATCWEYGDGIGQAQVI